MRESLRKLLDKADWFSDLDGSYTDEAKAQMPGVIQELVFEVQRMHKALRLADHRAKNIRSCIHEAMKESV